MARTLVLVASLSIICLLAFLTVTVAVREGIDILVILSLIVLARWASGCWARWARLRPMADGARLSRLAATLAVLAAPVAVGGAAYLAFAESDEPLGSASIPLALESSSASASQREPPPPEPEEPAPLIDGEPVPAIPLSGVDAFEIELRKPPRAGVVFDLDTGEVLWRRRPLREVPIAA